MAPAGLEDAGRILDGFLLLASGGSSTPDEVVSANLASLDVSDVVDEDLAFFEFLDKLDISDNKLNSDHILQQIGTIPKLGSLSLACNALTGLVVSKGTLRHLHTLDLSFNSLQGEVLGQLRLLKSLVNLNMSSNCVSLVPTEKDLDGFDSLEELSLDNNDLVQFIQWRALDALPRLKRLSLASNRIKRLRDDLPEFSHGQGMVYFRHLENLDLSCNEISDFEKLPVLALFKRLRNVCLSENVCTEEEKSEERQMFVPELPGIQIYTKRRKEWYLCGNGCFQGRQRRDTQKLKFPSRGLHRVASAPVLGPRRRRRGAKEACQLREEDRLIKALLGPNAPQSTHAALTELTVQQPSPVSAVVLDDGLSEADLEEFLRRRRSDRETKFAADAIEPPSFMRKGLQSLCTRSQSLSALTTPLDPIALKRERIRQRIDEERDADHKSQLFALTGGDCADDSPRGQDSPVYGGPLTPEYASANDTPQAGGSPHLPSITSGPPAAAAASAGVREALRALRAAALSQSSGGAAARIGR